MKNKSILNVLIVCLAFLLSMSGTGHAYFKTGEGANDFPFRQERRNATWGESERSFVLYDNFTHSLRKKGLSPMIYPRSNRFIPCDVIDGNPPLDIAIRHPVKLKISLANLLYANLKLKMLIDDYEKLRRNASELLGSPVELSDKPDLYPAEKKDEEESFHKARRGLEQEYRIAIRNYRPKHASWKNRTAPIPALSESLGSLFSRLKRQKKTSSTFSGPQVMEVRVNNPVLMPFEKGAGKNITRSESSSYRIKSAYSEDSSLPYIFNVLFKVFNYLLLNKIEAFIILGVIVFLLLHFNP